MMTSTPLEILTRYYDGLLNDRPGAREYAFSLWAPDASLTFAGTHPFSGTHHARSWLMEVYKPTLRTKVVFDQKTVCYDLVGDDRVGVSHYLEVFELAGGERLEAERFCIYDFADDQIVSMRVIDADPERVNDFFTEHFAGVQVPTGAATAEPAVDAAQ